MKSKALQVIDDTIDSVFDIPNLADKAGLIISPTFTGAAWFAKSETCKIENALNWPRLGDKIFHAIARR